MEVPSLDERKKSMKDWIDTTAITVFNLPEPSKLDNLRDKYRKGD